MEPAGDRGLIVQELIYAGLDALSATTRLDLCAYLHLASDEGPQLFLAAPDLASVDATEAFTLFSALRDAVEMFDASERDAVERGDAGDDLVRLGRYAAVAVASAGERSRGLHVFGRQDEGLDDGERAALRRLALALGRLVHQVDALGDAPGGGSPVARSPVRVAVETGSAGPRAEVSVALGQEVRTGAAHETTPLRAVAAAVIDAIDGSVKLVEATDGDVGDERAVLVLVTDERGRPGLGAALVGDEVDPLRAAAVAALAALR